MARTLATYLSTRLDSVSSSFCFESFSVLEPDTQNMSRSVFVIGMERVSIPKLYHIIDNDIDTCLFGVHV